MHRADDAQLHKGTILRAILLLLLLLVVELSELAPDENNGSFAHYLLAWNSATGDYVYAFDWEVRIERCTNLYPGFCGRAESGAIDQHTQLSRTVDFHPWSANSVMLFNLLTRRFTTGYICLVSFGYFR